MSVWELRVCLDKLFSCITCHGCKSCRKKRKPRTSPKHWNNQRQTGRYEYTALEDDSSLQERLELERKAQRSAVRETASLTCQYYLRSVHRYILLEQLNDIGSRIDKHWFQVRDTSVKTERLLTLVPQSEHSPLALTSATRAALVELFLVLQHPYIYPILDLDFRCLTDQTYVILVLPFNNKGSLKDLIYRSQWQDDWGQKYRQRSVGLPKGQIQRLGRQILEALLYLQDRGFPPFGHLHSGNVIIQNGVARLTGFENTLLGYTSRIYPVIKKRVKENKEAIDTICFGHVLFEMCAGYELCVTHPTPKHLDDIQQYPQIIEVLTFIFSHPEGRYPTVKEIATIGFFRRMDLREMSPIPSLQVFQAKMSPSIKNLLKDVRKNQRIKSFRDGERLSVTRNCSLVPVKHGLQKAFNTKRYF